ncbi:MAG TPA: NAD(P)H-dependent oxidoreductase [Vicinamibacterales bacterium]|nr:NAD(P)H-dependent oxidoreductase [Vicinamibacterales bacterium]
MEFLDVGGNLHAFGIEPRSRSNSISGIDGLALLGAAQIGAPRAITGTGSSSQLLTVSVSTSEAAEIGAITAAYAGDEKTQWSLVLCEYRAALKGENGSRRDDTSLAHSTSPCEAAILPPMRRSFIKEWNNKAAGFVSYGSAGGVRAVEHLRLIMAELQVADVRAQVMLSLFTDFENYSTFKPAPQHERTVEQMLDQVLAWGAALRAVRRGGRNAAA